METLEHGQMTSLKVLGAIYLRLGFFERAARLFQALFALAPEDAEIARSLTAALLENGEAEAALKCLAAPPLCADFADAAASRDPVLLLLQARALWRLQKNEEAFSVMDAYLAGAAP